MQEFADTRTEQVAQFGFARGVPNHIARRAHGLIGLLRASESLIKDVGKISSIKEWTGRPTNARGLQVEEKWFVTFNWDDSSFATNIRLERR